MKKEFINFFSFFKNIKNPFREIYKMTEEEKAFHDMLNSILNKENTICRMRSNPDVYYVSNSDLGYTILANSSYIKFSNHIGFRQTNMNEKYAPIIIKMIENRINSDFDKIESNATQNELKFINDVIKNIESV